MTSSRTGRGEQPPLFPFDVNRSLRRRREPATGGHTEEDVMERDRTRRPLCELDEVPQAAKIKVIGLDGCGHKPVIPVKEAALYGEPLLAPETDDQPRYAQPPPECPRHGA